MGQRVRRSPRGDVVVYLDSTFTRSDGHNRPYLDALLNAAGQCGVRIAAGVNRRLSASSGSSVRSPNRLQRRFGIDAANFLQAFPQRWSMRTRSAIGLAVTNLDACIGTLRCAWLEPGAPLVLGNAFASNTFGTWLAVSILGAVGRSPSNVVVIVHNRPIERTKPLFDFALRRLHRTVDTTVVVHSLANRDIAPGLPVVYRRLPYVRVHPVRDRPSSHLTFAFLGSASVAKGFDLLPAAITGVLERTDRARFLVQLNPDEAGTAQAAVAALRRLGSLDGRVEVLEGPLDDGAYAKVFERCDVMVLPHRAAVYAANESGVYLECVASGLPAIASETTAMGLRIRQRDTPGATFDDGNAASLSAAMLGLLLDPPPVAAPDPTPVNPAGELLDTIMRRTRPSELPDCGATRPNRTLVAP